MIEVESAADRLPDRMFLCTICGWLYEEARGLPDEDIPPDTRWEDLRDDFVCPECGAGREWFRELMQPRGA